MATDNLLDFIASRTSESLKPVETPSHTAVVPLPVVEIPTTDQGRRVDKKVRLVMHTDNLKAFLSSLKDSPNAAQLKIQGRVITQEQSQELENNPVYKFYMRGRFERATQANQRMAYIYMFPSSVEVTDEEAGRLLDLPFSVSSLSQEIGFETGFYQATDILAKWAVMPDVNAFAPQFGGVNELVIGSDSLSPAQVEAEAKRIHDKLEEAQLVFFNGQPLNINTIFSNLQKSSYRSLTLENDIPQNSTIEFTKFKDFAPKKTSTLDYKNYITNYSLPEITINKDQFYSKKETNINKRLDLNSIFPDKFPYIRTNKK